ncbi:hypothetical protein ACJX0J_021183 [Zea mays]
MHLIILVFNGHLMLPVSFHYSLVFLGAFFILSDNLYACLFRYSGDGLVIFTLILLIFDLAPGNIKFTWQKYITCDKPSHLFLLISRVCHKSLAAFFEKRTYPNIQILSVVEYRFKFKILNAVTTASSIQNIPISFGKLPLDGILTVALHTLLVVAPWMLIIDASFSKLLNGDNWALVNKQQWHDKTTKMKAVRKTKGPLVVSDARFTQKYKMVMILDYAFMLHSVAIAWVALNIYKNKISLNMHFLAIYVNLLWLAVIIQHNAIINYKNLRSTYVSFTPHTDLSLKYNIFSIV